MTNTNELRIPASFPQEEYEALERRFAELPEVTLPASLTAESLWARLDAQAQEVAPAPKQGKVVQLLRRYRPILSYAAVFVLMVAVYYGAGLDSPGEGVLSAPAPAAMPRMVMDAAPESSSAAAAPEAALEAAPEAAPEAAASPQMMMAAPPAQNNQTNQGLATATDGGTAADAPVDFTGFIKRLKEIQLEEGERLSFNLSQADNMIFINLSTQGEARLRDLIEALRQEYAIPSERVAVSAVAP